MAEWRLDGPLRTTRRYTTDQHCPLPTSEDWRLLILVYLQTYPLPVVQGRLFGMGQSNAHQWIHVRLMVLQTTLRLLGDAPTRSMRELAARIGVAEAGTPALVVPPEGSPAPDSPLLALMGPNGASTAPRIRLHSRAVIAARTRATRYNTAC